MTSLDAALARFGGRLWNAPAYLPYVQPSLTDEALHEAELALGVKLPSEYVSLLRSQNGGTIRGHCGGSRILRGIGPQSPSLNANSAWWKPDEADEEDWCPPQPDLLIPFDGEGHWDMCLDYRERGPRDSPSITKVTCDPGLEEPIAQSFSDYVSSLEDSYADTLRVYGDVDPAQLAERVSKALGGEEPTMDRFNHGYDEWRIALPGPTQWAWFHANVVPASFRRNGREIVVSQDTTLQLPEDPECSVLVRCTLLSRNSCVGCLNDLAVRSTPSA